MDHAQLFAFENDFVATLRCIPMSVRFKLDRSGVKLSLRQWSRFTKADRERFLIQPCETSQETDQYRQDLTRLVADRCGEAAKPLAEDGLVPWRKADDVPSAVADFACSIGLQAPSAEQWGKLSDIERFVLLKLSRDNHDNVNFAPAMAEFGLYRAASREA